MIKCLAVPARSAVYVGDSPQRYQLLGRVPDFLGNQACLLVMCQRLVVTRPALIDGADVVEHVSLVREVADVTVDRECPPAGGERFGIAALVVVHGANVVVKDRLVLGS